MLAQCKHHQRLEIEGVTYTPKQYVDCILPTSEEGIALNKERGESDLARQIREERERNKAEAKKKNHR